MEANGLEDKENTTLVIRRHYPVSPEKLWRAWTDPQALSAWFGGGGPGSVKRADVDLRVGGRYCIAFVGGDGEQHEASGVYQVVEPFTRLAFSWVFSKTTPDRVSRVNLQIEPRGDEGCELVFTHDRFFDQNTRNNYERGWTHIFAVLESALNGALQES